MKGGIPLILFLFFIKISYQECRQNYIKKFSILKGNYKNVLQPFSGAIISSKIDNQFFQDNNGSCLRDAIYVVISGKGYTRCQLGFSIDIQLMQKQLLNTLKIWFWDRDSLYNQVDRVYQIRVYGIIDQMEKIIYQSNVATNIVTIKFPDQFVQTFKIQNVGGNTHNPQLHIIKVEAYFKVNHEK